MLRERSADLICRDCGGPVLNYMTSNKILNQSELLDVARQYKSFIKTVAVFTAVINLLMLVPPLYMLQIYDRVLASRNEMTLLMLTLIMLGLFALLAGMEWVRSLVVIRVNARMDEQLNERVYTAAFEQNLKQTGGNAGQFIGDLNTLRQFTTGQGLFAFLDAPWFPIYLGVVYLFDWRLGMFATIGALILVALAWINERVTRRPLTEANQRSVQSNNLATNNLRNAEVIEAMGMLPNLRRRWYGLHRFSLAYQVTASEKGGGINSITKATRLALQSGILGYGALLAIWGDITPGMMIAASILMGRALAPVEALIGAWRQLGSVRSAYERLTELLSNNPARQGGMQLPAPKGHLEFQSVSAIPPGGSIQVIRGLSLSVSPGQIMAVVGPSGSGKSTLARLAVGVWKAQAGHVRLDGADVYQWNKDELGPHIGYLPQDIELFGGTVSENIARFGEVNAAHVVEAAQLAGVHEMILRMPKGYDTPLADQGSGLSGGQKQRIGLARALYGQPQLIVLDEPNSNLDEEGQSALAATITALREAQKSVVVITHNPNLIATVTHLLVLKDGQMQIMGPKDGVMMELAKRQNKNRPADSESKAALDASAKPDEANKT